MFRKRQTGHLTLRQLEIFEAVARLGSVTRAAEALHLTQPAVSLQVRSLAEAIGRPLTEPVGRGLRLTQAGRDLHETCRDLAAVWSGFEAKLDDEAALRRGTLRVSVVTTAKYFLPKALGLFVQQHPGIEVELEIQNREGVLARLRERVDDLYIMSAPPADLPVEAVPFLDNPLVVVAPRAYRAAREPATFAALAQERFLLREAGSGTRTALEQHLARERIRLARRMVVGSNEAIKQAVAGGLGLAVISRHAVSDADLPELRILPVRGFPIRGSWYIVRRSDMHLSAPGAAFKDFLREFAAAQRGSWGASTPASRPRRPRPSSRRRSPS